jgi:LAO/AO transport system kinase
VIKLEITRELEEKVEKAILENSKDRKISCTAARRIAEELGVPVRYVGNKINELKIKIWGCELGCF